MRERDAAPITSTRRRLDRQAEIVVGGFPRRPLMRERDAALDHAINEVAAILGDALVRLIFPAPPVGQVTSTRRRALMGLPVNAMKNETKVSEEIEALRNLISLQLNEKYRKGLRRAILDPIVSGSCCAASPEASRRTRGTLRACPSAHA
jgi:hypothetical protein